MSIYCPLCGDHHAASQPCEIAMPVSDVNDLDEVVRELGIEASEMTPAEAVREIKAELDLLRAERDAMRDGNRTLPYDRDHLGRLVREAWVRWAYTQPNPKPSWLVDYAELSEPDKEADRQIGESIARWTIIGDAARAAQGGEG